MKAQTKKIRIAFLVSGNGGLFQSVINACKSGLHNAEIVCCISDISCFASDRSRKENIPTFNFERIGSHNEGQQEKIFQVLCEFNPDLIILTFNTLLNKKIVTNFSNKIINVHPGLLPSFKGFGAIHQTIKSGVRYGGATIHFVDEFMDNGLIISQAVISINPNETEEEYGKKLFEQLVKMLNQVIEWTVNDEIKIIDEKVIIKNANYDSYPICPSGNFVERFDHENVKYILFKNIFLKD